MASGWRIIDCGALQGSLEVRRGQLLVRTEGLEEPAVLPLAELAVVLVGNGVTLGPSVLHVLCREDVVVLFSDWKEVPVGGSFGWSEHSRVAARHRAQAALTAPRRKNAWARIVRSKVEAQAIVLREFGHAEVSIRLKELVSTVRSGDPKNIEALAARHYWSVFFDQSQTRTPQLRQGLNALLDYGYAILRGRGIRAVLAAGLAPPLGLFHRGRANYFNLVDDLIEPFRPVVDYAVFRLPRGAELDTPQVKHALVEASSMPFLTSGETVKTALIQLAQQLGRYVEGDIPLFEVPVWAGPQSLSDA